MTGPEPPAPRSISPLLRRLGALRRPVPLTIAIVIVVNLALAGLYLWSRGGATTHLRIEDFDGRYRALIDGREIADAVYDAEGLGGIAISLPGDRVQSLPGPSGIDSVRITDADTGDVVLAEDFDGEPSEVWSSTFGDWHAERGVYGTATSGYLTTSGLEWGNYVIDVDFRNITSATVRVWREGQDSVAIKFYPFRRYDSKITHVEGTVTVEEFSGEPIRLDRGETIRSIVAMMVRPYPLALAIVIGAVAVAYLARLKRIEQWLSGAGASILEATPLLTGVLSIATLILLWYINFFVGDAMPHVPDSVAYLFQAKIFASFHVTADAPPVPAEFAFFDPPFLHMVDGRWFTQYPFGHPLFLAVGERVGAPWLVPPVLGAASVALIYKLGATIHGKTVGLLAALLLFFSPFFQMTSSNFMSHGTAMFVILGCLTLVARPKRGWRSMFVAGILIGLLFNMRPLVATSLIPLLGVFLVYELWRSEEREQTFHEDLGLVAGGLVMLLAYLFYNQATTGNFLDSPQTLTFGDTSQWLGFSGGHTVTLGLQNQQELLAYMLLVADGWPAAIGILFAALPFLLGTRNRWDYFLGASFLALASANIFYRNAAVMHGPRFWYETMPFLMLLTARGAVLLRDRAVTVAGWLTQRYVWTLEPPGRAVAGLAIFGLIAGLIASSAHGWMLEQRDLWSHIDYMPSRISGLEGFNATDARLLDAADEQHLSHALVFVQECRQWWCYGSVFWQNNPTLDGDIVWAQHTASEDDLELLQYYPDRRLYLANYGNGTISPTDASQLESLITPEEEAGP